MTTSTEHLKGNRTLILTRALFAGAAGMLPVPEINAGASPDRRPREGDFVSLHLFASPVDRSCGACHHRLVV